MGDRQLPAISIGVPLNLNTQFMSSGRAHRDGGLAGYNLWVFARGQAFSPGGKGLLAAPYNPAAPNLAPRYRPPVLACSDLITTCSAPVPGLLSCLLRARFGPQPVGCKSGNVMTLQGFMERSAERGAKNTLLAGKPDRRRRTEDAMIFAQNGDD